MTDMDLIQTYDHLYKVHKKRSSMANVRRSHKWLHEQGGCDHRHDDEGQATGEKKP